MEQHLDFCISGNRCSGCPMVGRPDDVLSAVGRALSKTSEERRDKPGEAARVTVRGLYEIGMEPRKLGTAAKAVTRAVDRILKDQCDRYDIHGVRRGEEEGAGEPDV